MSIILVVSVYVRMCLLSFGNVTSVLHLVRVSDSIVGSLFKVPPARGSDPYKWSLFF